MQRQEVRQYRIGEVLGKGGFGTVYRAELRDGDGMSRPVALKILHPGMSELTEAARRLRDEARMLGLLRHRAIVQVDGLLELDGRWAVAMEYIEGADLREILGGGPVPVGVALEIVQEICAALAAAWGGEGPHGEPLRLLHRDIKPANVQLTANGEVKLLDFGVARARFDTREAETERLFFGSLPYMAPERLDFVDSHAGDVYAVGVVLFELLTGEAFGETSTEESEHADKLSDARRRLRMVTPSVELVDLVCEMLAFDPERRPSARAVEPRARSLRQAVDDPWLSDWAEVFVPPLIEHRSFGEDSLSGSLLSESLVPPARASTADLTQNWPPWLIAGVAAALAATGVVGLGLVLLFLVSPLV